MNLPLASPAGVVEGEGTARFWWEANEWKELPNLFGKDTFLPKRWTCSRSYWDKTDYHWPRVRGRKKGEFRF